jgi:hypothetical protein
LQEPAKAIYNNQSYGPTFGDGYDFHVCDKANSSGNSYAYICGSYHNEKYKCNDKTSWKRFHGGSTGSYKFNTKEWEVWALEWA